MGHSVTKPSLRLHSRRERIAHLSRFVRVFAITEFKLKYGNSALGYVWTLIKPLAMFSVLYVVFGHVLRLSVGMIDYPLYLLIGIVLWMFFIEATTTTMVSLVAEGQLLRKLYFPRLVIPIATTVTASITLIVNLVAICALIAWKEIIPRPDWLLVIPLLLELYLFALGLAVILAVLYVRFRDMLPIWELVTQVLFYASPIIYTLSVLPHWARSIAMLNPFAQIAQDVRAIILYRDSPGALPTASDVLGSWGHIYPLAIGAAILLAGLLLFRRDEPYLAEMV